MLVLEYDIKRIYARGGMYSAATNVNDARRAKRLPGHQCFGLFS